MGLHDLAPEVTHPFLTDRQKLAVSRVYYRWGQNFAFYIDQYGTISERSMIIPNPPHWQWNESNIDFWVDQVLRDDPDMANAPPFDWSMLRPLPPDLERPRLVPDMDVLDETA